MIIPPLGLYIHIPFCVRKCPYCDFFSEKIGTDGVSDNYVSALIKELSLYSESCSSRTIESIYIGGGTPTLLNPKQIEMIMNAVDRNFRLSDSVEISMEANPGTVTERNIRQYRSIGINRLSLGVQSLNNDSLKRLCRIHDRHEALQAAENVAKYFQNFNIDLMHSLPGQSLKEAISDLDDVIKLNPNHISWYQLTIEEDTPYARNIPSLPKEDVIDSIYLEGYELLRQHSYEHYEVSAFAKKGFECRHNRNYWTFGDYLGAGSGAHSKMTENNRIHRQSRIENTCEYIRNISEDRISNIYASDDYIANEDLTFEYFLNRLRLFSPIPIREYEDLTGLRFENIRHLFEKYETEGLVSLREDYIVITCKGQLFINQMLEDFI
ncbi:MAG: radical SAM family heme chaperone HemW [Ruminobacter sp.]|uniref:radical SAM family heme chaperone HemW n=1 Tax=Ruminobacter sp. TaxID=2774296 RepID=UPI001B501B76|nr:radical SAM family heme chaperone HemW [Ruminobacter sp.]MBP3749292.1 radical SAM family heme chaperone HemW [Ruminobacter sp.]